ncbi:hypothetical protein OIU77_018548 [Salix suchowensis]|uniref:C-JID domain-containing protein n=1 Tax=Salix suchowensis TaxID=1278906 RepID=A0ABQ9CGA6_9ROSI|nr:hypothetical protein OIU77_018548 [Salix suchowensis]
MHDVLLKLGREIVADEHKEPKERSRLWDAKDVYRVLREQGTGKVESISLNLSETTEIELSPAAFEGMNNLRLLKFYYPYPSKERVRIHLPQGLHFLSNELRILDWCYYPLKSLPSNFFPENLVVLEMPYSKLEQLWNEYQPLENLKIMNLDCSSKLILSDFDFSNLPNLEVPNLDQLVELNLSFCTSLTCLPDSIELASLPESIGELKCLETLDLSYCSKLASLPNSIYGLESLEWLNLQHCSKLNRFPILNPRRSEVEEIASTTNKLGCLRVLIVISSGVLEIPASIKQLPVLTELNLSGCERLQHLPQLPSSLQVLIASECISLTSVEGIFMQGEKDYEAASQQFNFSDCPRLDQSSLTKIIGDARLRIQRMATSLFNQQYFGKPVSVRLCIPGSEVPEWFAYKNTRGPTVKIKLPAHWHCSNTTDQLFGFTLCAVVSFGPGQKYGAFDIKCECHLITKDGTQSDLSFHCYNDEIDRWGTWEREHVFIWSIQSHCSFKEASFHFKPLSGSTADAVVRSGVHPLFVEDCFDEPEQPQP